VGGDPNGSRFTLQESSTVKRRPKSRDKEPEGFSADLARTNGGGGGGGPVTTQASVPQANEEQQPNSHVAAGATPASALPPYQNGTGTIRRRPVAAAGDPGGAVVVTEQQPLPQTQLVAHVSAHAPVSSPAPAPASGPAPRRESPDKGTAEGALARKPKPPVSPKPALAQIKRQAVVVAGPPMQRVPLPGPGTPGSPGSRLFIFIILFISLLFYCIAMQPGTRSYLTLSYLILSYLSYLSWFLLGGTYDDYDDKMTY